MSEELTENTPLISNEAGASQVRVIEEQKRQLKVIYLIHFLSTITISIFTTSMFSFVIREENRIRLNLRVYNSFIIAQIIFSLIWGYYSDKAGRKKALNICLLGSALTIILFGFCSYTGPAAFASFLVGAFSCIYNVVKTIFGESTNKSNRPLSFIFLIIITAIAYYIGVSISVSLGSYFFIPPVPSSFSPDQAKFSPLIPCLIASGINIIAFILSHLYLSETLGKSANLEVNNATSSSTDQPEALTEPEPYTIFGLSFSKNNIIALIGFPLISIIFTGFRIIAARWSSNEVGKGGLNLNLEQISIFHLVSSIFPLLAIILYSSVHKRLGSLKFYKIFFLPTAVVFIISSMITLAARTGNVPAVITLVIFVISALGIFNYLQDISLNLLLIESSRLTGNLGTLFGISSALTKTFDLILPGLINLIYKISTERGLPFPLNYNLVWIILTITALIGHWSSSKIKDL